MPRRGQQAGISALDTEAKTPRAEHWYSGHACNITPPCLRYRVLEGSCHSRESGSDARLEDCCHRGRTLKYPVPEHCHPLRNVWWFFWLCWEQRVRRQQHRWETPQRDRTCVFVLLWALSSAAGESAYLF